MPGLGSDGGNPIPLGGVTFNGLGGAGSDTLTLEGGIFDSLTYNYDNAHDGDIELVDGSVTSTVNFVGLDPITDTTTAAVKTFNLLGGNDSIALTRVDATTSYLSGSTIENTTFTNPTDSLVINGGLGTDTIAVNGSDLDLGTAGIDLTAETINVYTGLTAASVATSGVNLSVSNNRDITVSGILGSGEGIDINHTGTVSMGGTDLFSSAANASIIIVAGGGINDVAVRSVTTSNGDFISTGGHHFTAGSNINTGTGIVDLNHAGGNVALYGNVTAGAFESNGGNLSVSNNRDITVSGNKDGLGINVTHTGTVSLAGTDLVSTEELAAINLQAGVGNHDLNLRSATTNSGAITTAGGRHLTLGGNLNAVNSAVFSNHGGTVNLGNHDVTASSVSIFAGSDQRCSFIYANGNGRRHTCQQRKPELYGRHYFRIR
ncbi:hypothetical protein [uncultured Gimesia sp.]|uniref:hypothetical protein n=1 Tax=uncultured Gimesia sp. TaxID=1678688 RepID=UPI0030DC73BC|tara:strand:- start:78102 stop:79400 length:1299 start_codon:yes stop_codon:yes gene_type:complete